MPEPAFEPQDRWDDLRPLLDRELSRLPDKYRAVIVLCDLEGKTRKEAARHFRLPEGTVATRLATARAMLAKRLGPNGLVMSGAMLGVVLSGKVASAKVPASVASITIKAATFFAAGQASVAQAVAPGVISMKSVALAEGVLKTMLLSKLKIATAIFITVAIVGVGAAAVTQQAGSASPGNQAGLPTNSNANQGSVVTGLLKEVDADKSTLTITTKEGEKTFAVTKNAIIVNNGRPGNLTELPTKAFVTLSVLADLITAQSVDAVGPNAWGVLKAIDADKKLITFDDKGIERTLMVTKNANVQIDGRQAKLNELPLGAQVTLSWFLDQKTARNLQANGRGYFGLRVKAVDGVKSTITFDDERAPVELAGKTFPVAKEAMIAIDGKDGSKLAGIPTGAVVHPAFSADQKTVLVLNVEGRAFMGAPVKAVDAAKNTITFEEERSPMELAGKTLTVALESKIQIDGKPGKLASVPPGAIVTLTLSIDQNTVRVIQAEGRQFMGVPLKSINATKNSITIDDDRAPANLAGKTLPVANDANISIDGKPAKLASIPPKANVNLNLSADQTTARAIAAEGRGFPGALVKAIDAAGNTITFANEHAPDELAGKTFPVAADASIIIDGKPEKLASVPPGVAIDLVLSVDQKTVRNINGTGPQIGAQGNAVVESVDAVKGTLTVDINPEGLKTFPVAKDASIVIDGKPGTLAGMLKEATVILTLRVDQKTVGRIEAKTP
jgi:RNase P/RNase MRP subunit p29